MKNIILVAFIFCLTVLSAYFMMTTDNKSDNQKDSKKHKTEQTSKKQDKALNIKTQKDVSEIIYSNKDEQTKMNAYNEAVKKEIIPRSNNYQNAELAFEESLKIKNEN
ncbi:hypothetical protein [Mammaliicoccus sciuri]|uniref:hypothetical protein n=2 Tax=Mammaliicoccus sciuri TaxID=1296 RepID=UPI002DBB98DF|nr:hypothetical protein [Mammaliicoccus sciuri]MEB6286917.1 hypothetical protein [Mammaliicoccus sciuri]MEB6695181.1 hypothetical protein [Mammaliicoccus sciuri]